MAEVPDTRASLLVRIRQTEDQEAWSQFVELYAPLVYGFARRQGLQDADAADLAQDVLGTVAAAAKAFEYDPNRGAFRSWLFTVCRTRLINFVERKVRQPGGSGDSRVQAILQELPSKDGDLSRAWELEYERRIYSWAADQVQREVQSITWRAFQRTAVEGQPAQAVARDLGMSVAAVYLAKSRVMARLKEAVRQIHGD